MRVARFCRSESYQEFGHRAAAIRCRSHHSGQSQHDSELHNGILSCCFVWLTGHLKEFAGMKMTFMMPGWSAHCGQTLSPYVRKIEEGEKILGHSVSCNYLYKCNNYSSAMFLGTRRLFYGISSGRLSWVRTLGHGHRNNRIHRHADKP